MLKAALYARVSSEEQAKRENSIPAQLRALREYCQKNNIEIFKEYKDATDIIGLKQNPTNGRRFSPIFLCIGHFSEGFEEMLQKVKEEN